MITLEAICELEKRLHHPDIRRSRHEAKKLFSLDFKKIGSSGKIYDRAMTLNAFESEIRSGSSITDTGKCISIRE